MEIDKSNIDPESLAKQLWAIGDPVRLQILKILPDRPTCERVHNVSEIATQIGLSQPATSHHLRVLRQAGLVANKKMCRDMIYWVRPEEAKAVLEALESVFENEG